MLSCKFLWQYAFTKEKKCILALFFNHIWLYPLTYKPCHNNKYKITYFAHIWMITCICKKNLESFCACINQSKYLVYMSDRGFIIITCLWIVQCIVYTFIVYIKLANTCWYITLLNNALKEDTWMTCTLFNEHNRFIKVMHIYIFFSESCFKINF